MRGVRRARFRALVLRRGGGLSPKRLCIYSLLSMCGRYPRREQSAHVGAPPPLPRSPGRFLKAGPRNIKKWVENPPPQQKLGCTTPKGNF
jgi:hypothetical protein